MGNRTVRDGVLKWLNWLATERTMNGAAIYGSDGGCYLHDETVTYIPADEQTLYYAHLGNLIAPILHSFASLPLAEDTKAKQIAEHMGDPLSIRLVLSAPSPMGGPPQERYVGIVPISRAQDLYLAGMVWSATEAHYESRRFNDVIFSNDLAAAQAEIIAIVEASA